MRCIICHVTKQVQSSNNTTHEHKGLLTYNPTHGITFTKKHIDNEHEAIVAKYVLHCKNENEASISGHEKSKKCKWATPFAIIEFFSNVWSFKSSNPLQLLFIEDLVLLITKGYVPLSTMESSWLWHLVMRQNGKVCLPTRKQLVKEHMPFMLAKCMDRYVLPMLT
jgi:hypothetical protein